MQLSRSAISRRRLAWLLWLALLLPLAQAAGHWHAASHAASAITGSESEDDDGKVLLPSHCALCLSIAALGDGAMAPRAPEVSDPDARHVERQQDAILAVVSANWPAYLSRAPPPFIPC
jgi:hypothetical protein